MGLTIAASRIVATIASLLIAGVTCAGEPPKQFPELIGHMQAIELFSLDPLATIDAGQSAPQRFHKWVVTGRAVPSGAASARALVDSMRKITSSHVSWANACFDPHHGITFSDGTLSFDVVMCFRCARYKVYGSDGQVVWSGSFDADGESSKWDAIFAAAGLRSSLNR